MPLDTNEGRITEPAEWTSSDRWFVRWVWLWVVAGVFLSEGAPPFLRFVTFPFISICFGIFTAIAGLILLDKIREVNWPCLWLEVKSFLLAIFLNWPPVKKEVDEDNDGL